MLQWSDLLKHFLIGAVILKYEVEWSKHNGKQEKLVQIERNLYVLKL